MPEDSGRITEEQKQAAIKRLTEKGAVKPCPFCGHPEWEVADYLVIDNGFSSDGIVLGGQAYPLLLVFCGNCAFARPHSAVALGLIPPYEEKKEAENGK